LLRKSGKMHTYTAWVKCKVVQVISGGMNCNLTVNIYIKHTTLKYSAHAA